MTKAEWKRLMFLHIQNGGCICYLCGRLIEKQKDFSLDHVVPLSRNGKNDDSNWKPTHRSCNWKKGSLTAEEYKMWLRLEYIRHGNCK